MVEAGSVLREKSLRTRERILTAAEKLFAEQGFDGASMRGITASAKVNLS
ncbi:MAG: TetR family transcriptional regulator, partial [Candidatus Spyradosoma sp.]